MIKPAIPSPAGLASERVLRPVKETLDILTGARSGELLSLSLPQADFATLQEATAYSSTLADKINEVIARLNRSGT